MESNKLAYYGGWALKVVAGLAFVAAGMSKLAGVEMMSTLR